MIATDHNKIKVFNIIMVLALAFALVAGAIVVKQTTSAANNIPPVAEAGPDQAVQSVSTTVHTGGFPNVQLDGTLSFDPNIKDSITYSWTMGSISNLPAAYTGNGWPGAGSGATITNPTSATPILNLSAASAGLYVVKLTVTDNGVSPNNLTAVDYVAVVAGQTWFVSLHGINTWQGQIPAYDQGSIGPWRTITYAINNANVKHGDRIMVGPNDSDGNQNDFPADPTTPAYALSGFGGAQGQNNEMIDINKWLTIWSQNGRDDKGETLATFATTINVSNQESTDGAYAVDQVVKISWPFGQSTFTTTGINAEKCGVVFGCDDHGFDLMGAPIGIYAVGADAVYIHQNRIEELTVVDPAAPDYNFWGILVEDSKAPIVDDNIVQFDGNDANAAIIGIELIDCDETIPNVLWYHVVPVAGVATGILNGALGTGFGGAQVINNVVILKQQDIIDGIMLTNCPKSLTQDNLVVLTIKESEDVFSTGIGLFGTDEADECDWSLVDSNIVIVDVDSTLSAIGKGIVVDSSDYVDVTFNNVQVQVTGESPSSMGALLGIGIAMVYANFSNVLNNEVDVNNVVSSLAEEDGAVLVVEDGNGIQDLSSDELAALQAAFDDIFSSNFSPTVMYAASLAIGIYAYSSDGIHIGSIVIGSFTGNMIDVCSRVTLLAANFEDDVVGQGTLKCAGASLAQGITVIDCDGAVIATNQLVESPYVTEPDEDVVGVHSWLEFIVNQYVAEPPLTPTPTPTPDALPDGIGKSGAVGILVYDSDTLNSVPVLVLYNTVSVLGEAEIELTGAEVETLDVGFTDSVLGQLGEAIGNIISSAAEVAASPDVNLRSLAIPPFGGISGDVSATFDPDAFCKGKGLVFGIGIATLESDAAYIQGNTVDEADSVLNGIIISETGTATVLPMSDAVVANSTSNLSLAIGILNYLCGFSYVNIPDYGPMYIGPVPTTIKNNLSIAVADGDVYVEAAQIVANSDGGGDAEAHGDGMSIGIGILVIGLQDTVDQAMIESHSSSTVATLPSDAIVTNNSSSGDGIFCLTTEGYNLVNELLSEADAFSVGLGGGIVVIGQLFPVISGNGDMTGSYEPGDELNPEDNFVYGNAEACANVDAVGLAQEDPDADGMAVAIGVGIATVFCVDPQITNNCNFHKRVYSAAGGISGTESTPYDPDQPFVAGSAVAQGYINALNQTILVGGQETYADGAVFAAGVGILVAGCEGAYVSENHAEGFYSGFYNYPVLHEDCFLAFDCDDYDIADGHPVWSVVDVLAIDEDPLEYVQAEAYGVSIACGILLGDVVVQITDVVVHLPFCIEESNTFEAGACIDILGVVAIGDPLAISLGMAVAIDAFIVFSSELQAGDDENFDIQPVIFNYNDMPGLRLSCAEGDGTYWVDFGMLVVNLNDPFYDSQVNEYDVDLLLVDARYNYWGDPTNPTDYMDTTTLNLTGPGGLGVGVGQPIYVVSAYWNAWVIWQPWLTINHEWCLDSHVGKFGKAIWLDKCWNTFSVPIALDSVTVDTAPYNTWAGFKELNPAFENSIGPAVWWDTVNGLWVALSADDELEPLMGYKVYVKNSTFAIILASTADTMPSIPVFEGWNLVGPNPPFCDCGLWVSDFVSSVVRTSGMDGFTQVVSQGGSQRNWSYTLGDWVQDEGDKFMQVGKAYWMFMNGDQTLAGFGFTRLPLYPEHFLH